MTKNWLVCTRCHKALVTIEELFGGKAEDMIAAGNLVDDHKYTCTNKTPRDQ